RVGKVHPGGPAQKAGIRPGDVIERIDGKAVGGLTSAQAAALVQREGTLMARVGFRSDVSLDGTLDAPPRPVKLRLARPGRAPWEVSLEHQTRRPESVLGVRRGDDNSWDYLLDRSSRVAHVRLAALNRGTAEELREVLGRLEEEARGLILDLRWCPGGFLDEA